MVCQPPVGIIYCPFALQDFGDGVPVRVVHLYAVRFHPFRYGDVIPFCDIAYGVQVLPELHPESVFDASVKAHLPTR